MAHPFITDAQATQKIQESYNDIVNSIGTGFQGTIKIADTPTEEGVYIPTEVGVYPNAGGLEYAPEVEDEGFLVQFIFDGAIWVKNQVDIRGGLVGYYTKEEVDVYRLLTDDILIQGTKQNVIFDADGVMEKIEHTNQGNIIREDIYTFSDNSITEVRELPTGEKLTTITNLNTLITNIIYEI